MENVPMLTENTLIGIVAPLAGIVFFAGLFLWVITGRNKKLAKEHAEEVKEYMDNLSNPIIEDLKITPLKSIKFDKPDSHRDILRKDAFIGSIKNVSVEHTEETKEDIDIKIALLEGSINHALRRGKQETVDALRAKLRKLRMERGAKASLEDNANDAVRYSFGVHFKKGSYENPDMAGGDLVHVQKGKDFIDSQLYKAEHILDKINRLHAEMYDSLDSKDYPACARIKKELDEAYEANPPKDFKF